MHTIRIEYFAVLRELRGLAMETLETDAVTAEQLWYQIAPALRAAPALLSIKVAVNDEFADWQQKLKDGDKVVFIPPVAGG